MRIFAISDLHTDFKENRLLVDGISDTAYLDDVLIVAGDIGHRLDTIGNTLSTLRSKFSRVFFTPGNHELWTPGENQNSIEKLNRVLALCDSLGVQTKPAKAGGVWIVPLLSWYESEFDTEDGQDDHELDGWADFHFCKWPKEIGSVADYFHQLNRPSLRPYDQPVISFSHFLPLRELLPARDGLMFKGLPKVAGSRLLYTQIIELKSITHVFGHSHLNRDCVIDGVRYIQNALRYPKQRTADRLDLKCIWPSDTP